MHRTSTKEEEFIMATSSPVRPPQADDFQALFLPHVDSSLRTKFIALMDLIKRSDDGIITRGQMNAALYPKSTSDSRMVQLRALKQALSEAAEKIDHQLSLVTPPGRGNDDQAIYLETDAPWEPPSTRVHTVFMSQQKYRNVPAQATDLTQNLVFVSYFNEEQELVETFINRVEKTLQGKADEEARSIRFWLFRRTNGDNGITAGDDDHDTMQRAITQARAGVLMVSPRACGRPYIKKDEWPRFRNVEGTTLKPFLSVMLSAINADEDDLGVLGRIERNRPQLFTLDGRAWDECVGNDNLAAKFVQQFIRDLRKKLFAPREAPLPPQDEPVRALPPPNATYRERVEKHIPISWSEKTLK